MCLLTVLVLNDLRQLIRHSCSDQPCDSFSLRLLRPIFPSSHRFRCVVLGSTATIGERLHLLTQPRVGSRPYHLKKLPPKASMRFVAHPSYPNLFFLRSLLHS